MSCDLKELAPEEEFDCFIIKYLADVIAILCWIAIWKKYFTSSDSQASSSSSQGIYAFSSSAAVAVAFEIKCKLTYETVEMRNGKIRSGRHLKLMLLFVDQSSPLLPREESRPKLEELNFGRLFIYLFKRCNLSLGITQSTGIITFTLTCYQTGILRVNPS